MRGHIISLDKMIKFRNKVYAHPNELLEEHINKCYKYYKKLMYENNVKVFFEQFQKEFCSILSEEAVAFYYTMIDNLLLFHDIGKINPRFQSEKMNNKEILEKEFKGVDGSKHSMLSATIYLEYFSVRITERQFLKEEKRLLNAIMILNAYVISRHHGGLVDFEKFKREIVEGHINQISKELKKTRLSGWYIGPLREKDIGNLENKWYIENKKNKVHTDEQSIYGFIYVRMLLSILVACDYDATTEYSIGQEVNVVTDQKRIFSLYEIYRSSKLITTIREYESNPDSASSMTPMNRLRSKLFLEIEKKLFQNLDKNIFFIQAPTGSGKSNIALNCSTVFLQYGFRKLVYIYPFNTLVEQNKEDLENIFGPKDELLQHMSIINSVTPIKISQKEEEEEYYDGAYLDRQFWHDPIILTTHVNFFNTLFGNSREAIFALNQLANSVIVLDEIQSYKNSIWNEIIKFLNAYSKLLNIKFIIMSATLPDLSYFVTDRSGIVNLVDQPEVYYTNPLFCKRVKISYELLEKRIELEDLMEHILKNNEKKKIVVEFIRKKTAYEFYNMLKETSHRKILLLTGDCNILERDKIIGEIKKGAQEGCILVTTQLIEAGVNIDMDIGYKDISLLDNEEQFLGRINRNAKRDGIVYFYDYDEAEQIYQSDFRVNKELTLKNKEMRTVLLEKTFPQYYIQVMELIKHNLNEQMNEKNIAVFFEDIVKGLQFEAVSQRMKLIEDSQWKQSIYLAREIVDDNGIVVDGLAVWQQYKILLCDQKMQYSEKQIKLSRIRSKMNYFIYEIKKNANLPYSDVVGELYMIEDGEKYFCEGVLDKKKLEEFGGTFIEL